MIILKPKINVDKRGKITTGIKVVNQNGKEYPKATDYFVIDDFPELKKCYGEKPKKLVLFFPDNEIESFFNADMVLYGKNQTLIRKCDGNECIHRIDEEVAGQKYVAGEISECVCTNLPEDDKKRCKLAMYMKAYVADAKTGKIENPLCYLFYTGSRNSAENLYSELKKIRNLLGGNLIGIPFGLSVEMVSGRTDAKQKFPIWNLQVLGTTSQLRAAIDSYLFDYKEILKLNPAQSQNVQQAKQLPVHYLEPEEEADDFEKEIKEKQNPEYWLAEINKIETYNQLSGFENEHILELTMFSGDDEEKIKKALANKRKEILDKSKQA